jgi:hypothetical protein
VFRLHLHSSSLVRSPYLSSTFGRTVDRLFVVITVQSSWIRIEPLFSKMSGNQDVHFTDSEESDTEAAATVIWLLSIQWTSVSRHPDTGRTG